MHDDNTARNTETARFLTIPEAAVRVGVSPDTIRRRIHSGELPARLFARKYRIAASDLDDLVRGKAA